MTNSITPPPHLLKKFSTEARDESNKRNGTGYLKTFAKLCIEWANSKSTSNDRQIRSSEIQPPPELVQQWTSFACEEEDGESWNSIATQAAQWGADMELEACCEWFSADVVSEVIDVVSDLRSTRRPKPPSLKEQAHDAYWVLRYGHGGDINETQKWNIIRRALEALDD